MWRPGSSVYAPQLTDNDQKLENIRQALRTLNDQALTPLEKAQIIEGVSGFGRNIATGLVMVFHTTEFAI
jgi:5-methylcytosine-specific restriction enzyme B